MLLLFFDTWTIVTSNKPTNKKNKTTLPYHVVQQDNE
jgi:hypothetical protein